MTFTNQAKSGYAIIVNGASATDIFTIQTPSTLAAADIVSGSQVVGGTTSGGLVSGTVYFIGSISGATFKLYKDKELTSLLDVTGTITGASITVYAGWTNQAES